MFDCLFYFLYLDAIGCFVGENVLYTGIFSPLFHLGSNRTDVICPCVKPHIPRATNVTTVSIDDCKNASYWRLLDGVCQHLPECPPGSRVQPVDGQAESILSCDATYTIYSVEMLLMETECQRMSY